MSKKRNEAKLTMHKLLGDHKMANTTVCVDCGIREGEYTIDPYIPVDIKKLKLGDMVTAILKLVAKVQQLEDQLDKWREQDVYKQVPAPQQGQPWNPNQPVGPYYVGPVTKPYTVTWGSTTGSASSGSGGGHIVETKSKINQQEYETIKQFIEEKNIG